MDPAKQSQQSEVILRTITSLKTENKIQNGGVSSSPDLGERRRQELPKMAARSATFPAFSSAVQIRTEEGKGRSGLCCKVSKVIFVSDQNPYIHNINKIL